MRLISVECVSAYCVCESGLYLERSGELIDPKAKNASLMHDWQTA